MPKRYWWVILTYIAMQLSGGFFRPLLLRLFPAHQLEALIFYSIFSFTIGLIIVLILMKPDMQMSQTRSKWFTSDVIGWTVLGVFLAYFAKVLRP